MPVSAIASASGLAGQIRVGCRVAAELRGWRATLAPRLPRTYAIRCEIARWDAYWRAETPWTLRVEIGDAIWEWADVAPIDESDDAVTFEVRSAPTVIRFASLPTKVGG